MAVRVLESSQSVGWAVAVITASVYDTKDLVEWQRELQTALKQAPPPDCQYT